MKLRVEIGQYEFVEADVEIENMREVYNEIKRQFSHKKGLAPKEWNEIVNELVSTGGLTGDPAIFDEMNEYQYTFVQDFKKGVKRINYQNEK